MYYFSAYPGDLNTAEKWEYVVKTTDTVQKMKDFCRDILEKEKIWFKVTEVFPAIAMTQLLSDIMKRHDMQRSRARDCRFHVLWDLEYLRSDYDDTCTFFALDDGDYTFYRTYFPIRFTTKRGWYNCQSACACAFCTHPYNNGHMQNVFNFLEDHGVHLSDGEEITEEIREKCRQIDETTTSHLVDVPSLQLLAGRFVYNCLPRDEIERYHIVEKLCLPKMIGHNLHLLNHHYENQVRSRAIIRMFLHAIQFHKQHVLVKYYFRDEIPHSQGCRSDDHPHNSVPIKFFNEKRQQEELDTLNKNILAYE